MSPIQDPFVNQTNTAAKLLLEASGFLVLSPPEVQALRGWFRADVPLEQRRRDLVRATDFAENLHLALATGRVMSS